MSENDVLVTVVTLAFNQEKYIRQCLEGIVSQKTTFRFELIVHDDASSDNTANIIREYQQKYPFIVKAILQEENQYSKGGKIGARFIYPIAKGKYIAECEGDDYWCDPNKLQKQVDFLEKHLDYGLCYGMAKQYVQAKKKFSTTRGKDYVSFENYLLCSNCIPTLTVCYRKELLLQYLQEKESFNQSWKMGDYPQWLWFSVHSKLKFFPEIFGVYRILKNSAAHSTDIEKQISFHVSGRNCANFFSKRYLNKELPPFEEHHERARLYSTRLHDRKKAYEEYKLIPHKNSKYKILAALHSNPVTFLLLRIYYSLRHKQ